jgi:hypothetical protein
VLFLFFHGNIPPKKWIHENFIFWDVDPNSKAFQKNLLKTLGARLEECPHQLTLIEKQIDRQTEFIKVRAKTQTPKNEHRRLVRFPTHTWEGSFATTHSSVKHSLR